MLESVSKVHRALRSGGIRLEREYETISKNRKGLEGSCIISKVSWKQISALRYNTKLSSELGKKSATQMGKVLLEKWKPANRNP